MITLCALSPAFVCSGADYDVDAVGGNDSNAGRGPQVAWQTLNKVNLYTDFLPGDRFLMRRCCGTCGVWEMDWGNDRRTLSHGNAGPTFRTAQSGAGGIHA